MKALGEYLQELRNTTLKAPSTFMLTREIGIKKEYSTARERTTSWKIGQREWEAIGTIQDLEEECGKTRNEHEVSGTIQSTVKLTKSLQTLTQMLTHVL